MPWPKVSFVRGSYVCGTLFDDDEPVSMNRRVSFNYGVNYDAGTTSTVVSDTFVVICGVGIMIARIPLLLRRLPLFPDAQRCCWQSAI